MIFKFVFKDMINSKIKIDNFVFRGEVDVVVLFFVFFLVIFFLVFGFWCFECWFCKFEVGFEVLIFFDEDFLVLREVSLFFGVLGEFVVEEGFLKLV